MLRLVTSVTLVLSLAAGRLMADNHDGQIKALKEKIHHLKEQEQHELKKIDERFNHHLAQKQKEEKALKLQRDKLRYHREHLHNIEEKNALAKTKDPDEIAKIRSEFQAKFKDLDNQIKALDHKIKAHEHEMRELHKKRDAEKKGVRDRFASQIKALERQLHDLEKQANKKPPAKQPPKKK